MTIDRTFPILELSWVYREGAKIVLEPVIEVPAKDHWIYENPDALASLMKGIKDAEEGRLRDLGSFAGKKSVS